MAAAKARKLQLEIDNVLKKVDEGLEEFEEIWDNAHDARCENKDKQAEELKKSECCAC